MWFWIALIVIFIVAMLWCLCAGSKTNDDEEQAKSIAEWYRTHQGKIL